jgi:hypothetical protein
MSRLPVGPELDLVQPFERRDGCSATVGDDHRLARHELLAADFDRPQVDEPPLATHQLRTGRLKRRRGSRVVEVARHPQHTLGNFGKVHVPLHPRCSERACTTSFFQRLARAQQGLRRDATPVRAFAADQLALDYGKREPASFESVADGFPRHASAKADDIKFLCQPDLLLLDWRAEATPAMTWL